MFPFWDTVPVAAKSSAHLPEAQLPLRQSSSTLHIRPDAHFGQVPPPQSTSVSPPFCT
jgi:hypothetical protein